ncbi:hypothetical protein F5Y18DRAFT_213562 [Xylariaceae sp. FL1019]|nr:hypothetical protein F5Y18DRAFT_213562 [Xylariaceae sp. FL1019]
MAGTASGGLQGLGGSTTPSRPRATTDESTQTQSKVSVADTSRHPQATALVDAMEEKGNFREWERIKNRNGPLELLSLPVDVLRLIVAELTISNDLIALALTNSALYELTLPRLYARFDIVWPDVSTVSGNPHNIGVDALSYGLATMCFPSRFADKAAMSRRQYGANAPSLYRLKRNLAQHIRKFAMGDGPAEWIDEYIVGKEMGKMLGTLVAIAIEKMPHLEIFKWDMPTGVSSDTFTALASLQNEDGHSQLNTLWIRWHDNSQSTRNPSSRVPVGGNAPVNPIFPPQLAPQPVFPSAAINGTQDQHTTFTAIGKYLPSHHQKPPPEPITYATCRVEYPTFSIISPLKSLTVLNIDELFYLDEMAVLIERSASRLRELRIGLSGKASMRDQFQAWDGPSLQQVDHEARWPGECRIPDTRLGGVLGILVGRIYDLLKSPSLKVPGKENSQGPISGDSKQASTCDSATQEDEKSISGRTRQEGKLKLRILALERVALSIQVCTKAIDWSCLTKLTILSCPHHEALWKALRRQFKPTTSPGSSQSTTQYHLSLKYIHTDRACPSLVIFTKETLAPNSLEVFFLQDGSHGSRTTAPPVTAEQIFKNVVKQHRNSLRKLLVDSSKLANAPFLKRSSRGRLWAIKDDFLSFVMKGGVPNLRELGMIIYMNDFHKFLQHLPQMQQLRTLYIPHMALKREDKPMVEDASEFALQIVDAISLRRDIPLARLGLGPNCYDIREEESDGAANASQTGEDDHGAAGFADDDDDDGDSGSETGSNTDEDDDDHDGGNAFPIDTQEEQTEDIPDVESEPDALQQSETKQAVPHIRLRQTEWNDEKVELFQARHGKL